MTVTSVAAFDQRGGRGGVGVPSPLRRGLELASTVLIPTSEAVHALVTRRGRMVSRAWTGLCLHRICRTVVQN